MALFVNTAKGNTFRSLITYGPVVAPVFISHPFNKREGWAAALLRRNVSADFVCYINDGGLEAGV